MVQKNKGNPKIIEYFSMFFISLTFFLPIFYSQIFLSAPEANDYTPQISAAQATLEAPETVPTFLVAHAAYLWAVVIVREILKVPWLVSGLIVTLLSVLSTILIVFRILRNYLNPILAGLLAIGMNIIAPLALLYPLDQRFYFGYIGLTTYHNATILFLRPFALLQAIYAINTLQGKKINWIYIVTCAFISAISTYAKPSYAVCLLPTLVLIGLFQIWKKKPIDLKLIFFGLVLPSTIVLIWQFLLEFGLDGGIILAPFEVISRHSSFIFVKMILSISFPLLVTLTYWKESRHDLRMQFGWIGFVFGAILTYFFAESGERFLHGNFFWSGQITLFILFIICLVFLIEKGLPKSKSVQRWLILSTGSLHIVFGILYYLYVFITKQYS